MSGMCGLVYEVIWVRHLSLVVGATTVAVSLVVAAFLLGLVLGSLVLGRLVDRTERPLRVYALCELATGVAAAAVTFTLTSLPVWVSSASLSVRVAVVFALVLAPTFAMGGTLPALVRFAARDVASVGKSFGGLYALNTLGAALGCGLAGFVLIGAFGLQATALIAAATNGVVAVAAMLLDEPRPVPVVAPVAGSSPGSGLLLWAFAASGFASIGYEILWFRVLASTLESSVYAFTLLLVVFLLGLVLGGAIYTARLAGSAKPLERLVGVQSLVALTALLSLALLGQARTLEHALPAGYVFMAIRAGLVILVPATVIGITFPLVAQLTATQLDRLGRTVGLLYSVNTLGGIAGSLLVGLLLIPWLGTQRTFALICVLSMGVAAAVQRVDAAATGKAWRRLAVTGALLVAGLALLPKDALVLAAGKFDDSKLLEVREGADGTLAALHYDHSTICDSGLYACDARCAAPFSHRQLLFGSVSYASTVMPARRYMRTLAHVPMLLHPAPRDVLEVCFGTGTTAAAFTRHADLRSLTIVDLNRDVFAMAPHFADSNLDVLKDPRVTAIVDDGRHHLRAHDGRYDVISFEPPPPRSAGAVNLYSKEFYELVRARLKAGGVMSQWIPLDQQSDVLARRLIRSMTDVFAHVTLWVPARAEGVLIASDAPVEVDATRWRARFDAPAVKASLADVGYATPEALLGASLLGDAALRRYVGDVPPVTDDDPAIEYFLSDAAPPYSIDALIGASEALSPDAETEQHRHLLRAHALGKRGESALASDEAGLAGDSAYVAYLQALEYGCLVRKR